MCFVIIDNMSAFSSISQTKFFNFVARPWKLFSSTFNQKICPVHWKLSRKKKMCYVEWPQHWKTIKFLQEITVKGAFSCIQRETWDMGPSAGADFDLTLSHSRQLRPAFQTNDIECRQMFPQIFKIEEQPLGKRTVEKRGGKGWELTLYLKIDILWSMVNPMPE